jgi:hypothetical protein
MVDKGMTCGFLARAQYVSRRVSRKHVSAGQGQVVPRPPEPRAQVRILPGALVICTNPNALTTLTQPKPRHLTRGDTEAFPTTWCPIRARSQMPNGQAPVLARI